MYLGFSENVLYFYDMPAGHSHRHIGDVEDLEHVDPDGKFIMVGDTICKNMSNGRVKKLSGYARITIDFGIETKEYSHRYTAVYYSQKSHSTKFLTVYSYIDHHTILGKPDRRDLAFIPKFLYVYNPDAKIWEKICP